MLSYINSNLNKEDFIEVSAISKDFIKENIINATLKITYTYLPVVKEGCYLGLINIISLFEEYNIDRSSSSNPKGFEKHLIKEPALMKDQIEKKIKDKLKDKITKKNNFDYKIIPIVDESNIYTGFIDRDQLEIYRLNKYLESIEYEFESILDSSQDGIHITDGKGITIRFNKACERTDNVRKENIIGTSMEDMVKKGVYSESVALKVRDSGQSISVMQQVNGKEIMATGTPIYKDNEMFRIVVNSRDISELAETQRQLEEANYVNAEYKYELDLISNKFLNGIIFKSKSMEKTLDLALRVAGVDSTILVQGESGVGKGVLSRFIHNNSPRSKNAFMKIDCSVIPEKLLESELFGYEKGAFTGASQKGKIGLIEVADGGTLFLDEIGELPLSIQAKLLCVIQDKNFLRIGGKTPIEVDIRIIAATNWNLKKQVEEGHFRKDLYYRLNVIPMNIEPLRERREDIFPLIENMLKRVNERYGFEKKLDHLAIEAMLKYNWPGNVRELENIVERMVVVSRKNTIMVDELPSNIIERQSNTPKDYEQVITYEDALETFEFNYLSRVMNDSKSTQEMADKMGIDRSTVRRKLKKRNISIKFE